MPFLAYIPYFTIPVFKLGPVPIDPWATLVCIGFIVGLEVTRSRGIRLGLDVRDIVDGIVFTVGSGFLVGHLVHVLAYNPHELSEQGVMALIKVWGGFSSFGGFLGAVIGSVVFYRLVRKRPYWVHADTIMYGFPFGWVFGRMGCATVHDHIGIPTTFPLAMDFPQLGPRHELGLYEAVYTCFIALTFFLLRNKLRKPGSFLALWCVVYAPVRFLLDFLRNTDLKSADVRWAGLTPAQWGSLAMFGAGIAIAIWLRKQPSPPPYEAPVEPGDPSVDPASEIVAQESPDPPRTT